jgi:hypothetical protein
MAIGFMERTLVGVGFQIRGSTISATSVALVFMGIDLMAGLPEGLMADLAQGLTEIFTRAAHSAPVEVSIIFIPGPVIHLVVDLEVVLGTDTSVVVSTAAEGEEWGTAVAAVIGDSY